MPDISVVIPLYNKEKHVARTLESILGQKERNLELEVIVVDDGSTDRGAEIVKSYLTDSRVHLISQSNQGIAAARNRGLKEASAALVAFLDADDTWKPDFLAHISFLAQKYPRAGIYGTSYEFKERDGTTARPIANLPGTDAVDMLIKNPYRAFLAEPPVHISSVVFPRQVVEEVGGFDLEMGKGEDTDVYLRIFEKYSLAYMNVTGSTYHRDAENRICNTPGNLVNTLAEQIEKYYQRYPADVPFRADLWELIVKAKVSHAKFRMLMGHKQDARKILLKYRKTRMFKKLWWKYFFSSFLPLQVIKHRRNQNIR